MILDQTDNRDNPLEPIRDGKGMNKLEGAFENFADRASIERSVKCAGLESSISGRRADYFLITSTDVSPLFK